MHVKTTIDDLRAAISRLTTALALPGEGIRDAPDRLHLVGRGDALVLVASGVDHVRARTQIGARVDEPGNALLDPAGTLVEAVRAAPEGDAIVSVGDSKLTSDLAGVEVRCDAGPADDRITRPRQPDAHLPPAFADLLAIVESAAAASTDDRDLDSVLLQPQDGRLHATATDGHRMATASTEDAPDIPTTQLPIRAVRAVQRLIADGGTGEVTWWSGEGEVAIGVDETTVVAEPHDRDYPTPDQLADPDDYTDWLVVDTDRLTSVVETIIRTGYVGHAVQLAIDGEGLQLGAVEPSRGVTSEELERHADPDRRQDVDAEASVELERVAGQPSTPLINGRYLLDALEAIDTEAAEVRIDGTLDPVVVRPAGDPQIDQTHWVMPMRQ